MARLDRAQYSHGCLIIRVYIYFVYALERASVNGAPARAFSESYRNGPDAAQWPGMYGVVFPLLHLH